MAKGAGEKPSLSTEITAGVTPFTLERSSRLVRTPFMSLSRYARMALANCWYLSPAPNESERGSFADKNFASEVGVAALKFCLPDSETPKVALRALRTLALASSSA